MGLRAGDLTVKLRGRTEVPDQSRGRTISSRARGDTTDSHGPLQRLLDAVEFPRGAHSCCLTLEAFAMRRASRACCLSCHQRRNKAPRMQTTATANRTTTLDQCISIP